MPLDSYPNKPTTIVLIINNIPVGIDELDAKITEPVPENIVVDTRDYRHARSRDFTDYFKYQKLIVNNLGIFCVE